MLFLAFAPCARPGQAIANITIDPEDGLSQPVFTITNPVPGTYTFSLTVRDDDAGLGHATSSVVVNHQPVAALVINASLTVDGEYDLYCDGTTDVEDSVARMAFTWAYASGVAGDDAAQPDDDAFVAVNTVGTLMVSGTNMPGVFTASRLATAGVHWLRVTATDTDGGVSTAYASFRTELAVTAGMDVALNDGVTATTLTGTMSGTAFDPSVIATTTWWQCGGPTVTLTPGAQSIAPSAAAVGSDHVLASASVRVTAVLPTPHGNWSTVCWAVLTRAGDSYNTSVRVRSNAAPVAVVTPSSAVSLVLPAVSTTLSAIASTDDEGAVVAAMWRAELVSAMPTFCGEQPRRQECNTVTTVNATADGTRFGGATLWRRPFAFSAMVPGEWRRDDAVYPLYPPCAFRLDAASIGRGCLVLSFDVISFRYLL